MAIPALFQLTTLIGMDGRAGIRLAAAARCGDRALPVRICRRLLALGVTRQDSSALSSGSAAHE